MASPSWRENQEDNAVSIPYQHGLSLGHGVDVTKPIAKGRKLIADGVTPISSQINLWSCKFSLATSLSDVCEVLDIPYEYALKVEAGHVPNDVVKACLHDIKNNAAFKVIFRLRFLKERKHFTSTVNLTSECAAEFHLSDGCDTHAVDALHIGDELVTIMTLSASESDALQTFSKKTEQMLGKSSGQMGEGMIDNLEKMADSLDSKLSKSHYKNVNCVIEYGSFVDLDTYPASVSGMVGVMKSFRGKWTSDMNATVNTHISTMILKIGADDESERYDSITRQKMLVHATELFYLRVTLQPNKRTVTMACQENNSILYEHLFYCICAINKTYDSIQGFLAQHSLFSNKDYKFEGEDIYDRVSQRKDQVIAFISSLDMVDSVSEKGVKRLQEALEEMRDLVDEFKKKVTTKLPVGGNLNLLIIGKTGHGKSSTANTILGRNEFQTSSGGISKTKKCQRAWADIDGRTFKVVDIPGVCDTDMGSMESVQTAMECVSEAITECSEGFHALLLVIRYGNRMTEEEERAIYMLKCILGSTIVHSHCICVVTHGDNFDETEGSFEQWCKYQEGFLKEVFEECKYRCVLFNNKTSDLTILKTQLIELVSKVDSLEHRGSCYTNDIFKYAEADRQRLIEELQLPEFKEEIMRDLNLLQCEFENVENADGNERNTALERLKKKTDDLRLKLDEVKRGRIADLYQAVSNFSEKLFRMEEKDLADAQLRLERERFKQEEQRLIDERETMERRIVEQTQQRIREAAQAAEEKERQLRELEKKNWEDQRRHEEEVKAVRANVKNYYKKKSRWVQFRDSLFKW